MSGKKRRNRTEKRQPPEIEGFEDVFRTGLSPDQVEFLFAHMQHGSINKAARESGIDRSRHYEWMRTRLYAECFEASKKHVLGALENEAHRRAMDGVMEPVFGKDGLLGKRRRYSDSLLVKLLEANGPEKYGKAEDKKPEGVQYTTVFYDPSKGPPPEPEDLDGLSGNGVVIALPDNGRGGAVTDEERARSPSAWKRPQDQTVLVLPVKAPRPEEKELSHESG